MTVKAKIWGLDGMSRVHPPTEGQMRLGTVVIEKNEHGEFMQWLCYDYELKTYWWSFNLSHALVIQAEDITSVRHDSGIDNVIIYTIENLKGMSETYSVVRTKIREELTGYSI